MHPDIERFLNIIRKQYYSEKDIPKLLAILKENKASRVQAFITLNEGLHVSDAIADKYILESNLWKISNDLTEDFFEVCLYSSKWQS